jgi:hypothetical protein
MMKHSKVLITFATSLTFIMLTCFYHDTIRVRQFKTFSLYRISFFVKNQILIKKTSTTSQSAKLEAAPLLHSISST